MDYGDFGNVPGGYTGTDLGKGYATTKPAASTKKIEVPSDFSYLSPIFNGAGDYHFNHFIAYIDPLQNDLPTIESFYEKFCNVFSLENIAKVMESERSFNGHPAFKFTLGGNIGNKIKKIIGFFHDDWVAMQMFKDGKSFYATTLKREWNEPMDNIVFNALETINPLEPLKNIMMSDVLVDSSPLLSTSYRLIVDLNKKHFLAGRRSWSLGYDSIIKLYYVETAALERNSDIIYSGLVKAGGMRQDIIDLWANLLANFAPVFGIHLCLLSPPIYGKVFPKDYKVQNNVAYQTGSKANIADAVNTPWFATVLKRHLGLIQDL
ncbi:MAG: hypothetical protein JWN78_1724 [Bacteroidota bacterium]|nr:hypothetical protein [Bacteroidota bacterium]